MRNSLSKSLRQSRAIGRLQNQLESGVKTMKGSTTEKIPLTEVDKKRITKEINKLKSRI